MRRAGPIVLWAILTACSGKPAPVADVALLTPRPFGYVIGDEIRHRVELTTHNGVRLNRAGLPKPGVLTRWLQLNDVRVSESKSGDGFQYRIELNYQIFYAPLEVKMLTIPGFDLPLTQGENAATQAVPAWPFTLSPLRELAIRKDERGEYLRPDVQPRVAVGNGLRAGIAASALSFVLSVAYLGVRYALLPGWPRRNAFQDAARALARLSPCQWGVALASFHIALNTLNVTPLFKPQLSGFLQRHPGYRSVAEELAWFFDCSEQYFFAATGDAPADLARLRRLCARCLDIERELA